jgi:hypothetical protein
VSPKSAAVMGGTSPANAGHTHANATSASKTKVIFLMVFLSKKDFGILKSGGDTMATATKMKKTAQKTTAAKKDYPPLPPAAKVVEIGGRECVIVPLDEYDDWLQDTLLTVVAADRLERDEGTIPFEEVEARLDAKRKRR